MADEAEGLSGLKRVRTAHINRDCECFVPFYGERNFDGPPSVLRWSDGRALIRHLTLL
jgi:hypothetical protein